MDRNIAQKPLKCDIYINVVKCNGNQCFPKNLLAMKYIILCNAMEIKISQKPKKICIRYILILWNAMEITISQKPKKIMYMIYINLVKCNGNQDFPKN